MKLCFDIICVCIIIAGILMVLTIAEAAFLLAYRHCKPFRYAVNRFFNSLPDWGE